MLISNKVRQKKTGRLGTMFKTIITDLEALKVEKVIVNRMRDHENKVTLGTLNYKGFKCFTLELPWLDNKRNESCIPPAKAYKCVKHNSPRHGYVIKITNVLDRTHILIHAGNFVRQIEGCVLVGDSIKFLDGDNIPDVTNSKTTMQKLMEILPKEFYLEIN